jgi:hypothetical protein
MSDVGVEQAYFCCLHCGAEIEEDLPPLGSGLEFWPRCEKCDESLWLVALRDGD